MIVEGLPDITNDKKVRARSPSMKGNSSSNTMNSKYNGGSRSNRSPAVLPQEGGSQQQQQQPHKRHNSFGRGVSFADDEGNKMPEEDSTISTCSYFEDDLSEAMEDGEEEYLRGYMSNHCFRKGLTRYAIKRLRPDLKGETKLNATIDLASEGMFL